MTTQQIKALFDKDTSLVEPTKVKAGDYIKFIDYTKFAQGIGLIQSTQQPKPGAPVKLVFKSSVLDHDYIMVKPTDKVMVLK